ncbi:MAG TPA: glycosyltransferase family 4 protein [Patescibacteria group bacterium]|nr:glycosyltransferase family 4 protein [Patescibacteria group bacterium]
MKIAQLHPYPPELLNQIPILPGGIAQGGSETSSWWYTYKLAEAGHDVTYYVARYPGITAKELRINEHLRIVYLKTIFKNVGPAFSFRLFWELFHGRYDIIQSHQIPTNFSLTGALVAKLTRKPFIITFHGRLPAMFIDRFVGTFASWLATAVTVQNQYTYDLVKYFVPTKRLKIIPHGIDTDQFHRVAVRAATRKRFKPVVGNKVIVFVGRMIPPKGVDVLLEAYAAILRRHKNVTLILAGDGPQRAEYEAYAKKLGVYGEGKALFVGSLQQAVLPEVYSLSDVFVLPTAYHYADGTPIPNVSENFGLVIAEAMSCEVPVVAARIGGIPMWVADGKVARLFTERDITDLAAKLEDALFDPEERNLKLIAAAKKMIDDKYSWEAVIRQFTPLFRKHG